MAAEDPRQPPSDRPAVPVPQLIEKYRAQREAWMAEADELARLRDQVRGAAEQEAVEIVTSARRDIRKIIMEARRELFVLSAQVHAVLGEPPPAAQLGPAAPRDNQTAAVDDELAAFAKGEWGLAPRSAVAAVLEEARANMAVLDHDARAVPARTPSAEIEPPGETIVDDAQQSPAVPPPSREVSAAADQINAPWPPRFAIAFGVAAFVALMGALWALRSGDTNGDATRDSGAAATSATQEEAARVAAGASAAPEATRAPQPPSDPTAVRLSIEAARPAWIRAVVDGRGNAGRLLRAGETYEATGRTIALRVGDAGAVRISVNGSEPRTLGRDGQVVDREYTSRGETPPGESRTSAEPPAVDLTRAGVEGAVASEPPSQLPAATAPVVPANPAVPPVAATTGSVPQPPSFPASDPDSDDVDPSASPVQPHEAVLVSTAQRWLDAYHRQDHATLATLSAPDAAIADERPTTERIPAAAGPVARTIDRVSVRLLADTAVVSGIMTERVVNGGLQRSSPVSLVWVSADGSWRLTQARLVSQSTLGQIFR